MTTVHQSDLFESDREKHTEVHVFAHARFSNRGYELSSQGDKRFSALFARLKDGRTIEEAYQLDVKGYRAHSNDWRAGKGKPALDGLTHEGLWLEYIELWRLWSEENPQLLEDLRNKAQGLVLTDKFATSPVSQARALAQILNETQSLPAMTASPKKPSL